MKHTAPFWVLLLAAGCAAPDAPTPDSRADRDMAKPFPFPAIDDNIVHDTLLIQTTLDLGDSTYLMVASNVTETFEGLRLYRYRFTVDSLVEMMAISPPAYDSWTMLPTCFPIDTLYPSDGLWVLANFGERESWGQKVLLLDWEFMDAGFMHVALPERLMEDDTLRLKCTRTRRYGVLPATVCTCTTMVPVPTTSSSPPHASDTRIIGIKD
jgi:hypothetical protein